MNASIPTRDEFHLAGAALPPDEAARVEQLRCLEMQGFHFGRPVAAADCPLDACFLLDVAEKS